MRQVAEFATQFFITDNKCNCAGLVLAGSAEFKNELQVRAFPRPAVKTRVRPISFLMPVNFVLDGAVNQINFGTKRTSWCFGTRHVL